MELFNINKVLALISLFLLLAFGLLQYHLFGANGSLAQINDLTIQINEMSNENARLIERNLAMQLDIYELKNNDVLVEERARFDLGLIKPFETLYIFTP